MPLAEDRSGSPCVGRVTRMWRARLAEAAAETNRPNRTQPTAYR